jgi:hypothetical protein
MPEENTTPNIYNFETDVRLSPIDRQIIGLMIDSGCDNGEWLTTNQIAERLKKITWVTVDRHLSGLFRIYYVKRQTKGATRNYTRDKIKIRAERNVEWSLNVIL